MKFSSRKLSVTQKGGNIKIGGRRFHTKKSSVKGTFRGGFVRAGTRILSKGGSRKRRHSRRRKSRSHKHGKKQRGGAIRDGTVMQTRLDTLR